MNLVQLKLNFKDLSLEKRLVAWVCLIGTVYSILSIVIAFLSNVDFKYYLYAILGMLVYPIFPYVAFKYSVDRIVIPLVLFTQYVISAGWIASAGSKGSTDLAFILLMVAYLAIFDKKWHLFSTMVGSLNLLVLIFLDWKYPDWVEPFKRPIDYKIDYLSTLILTFSCIILVMKITKGAFESERSQVAEKNRILNEQKEELILAKNQAEASMKAKSDFLSVMSHEMRTPLNAIIGSVDYLMMEEGHSKNKELIKSLQFSSNNLHSLINDILDFNKIEANKLELKFKPVNLNEFTKQLCDSLAVNAKEKLLSLSYVFDSQIYPWVKIDDLRIGQVLTNLIGNAIKFTEKGRVDVKLQLIKKHQESQIIRFLISDTGIGIKSTELKNIFEKFTQVSSSNTRNYGGTGLGLTITKGILKCFESEINTVSRLGSGSCFWFDLNLEQTPFSEKENKNLKVISSKSIKGKRVLLVEDNKINIAVASKFLNKWELDIEVAENGLIAFEKSKEKKFDIILMDIQMPIMDGIESTQKIRSESGSKNKETTIIALTASSQLVAENEAKLAGMNGYVCKPFKGDELLGVLNEKVS